LFSIILMSNLVSKRNNIIIKKFQKKKNKSQLIEKSLQYKYQTKKKILHNKSYKILKLNYNLYSEIKCLQKKYNLIFNKYILNIGIITENKKIKSLNYIKLCY